MKHIPSVPVVVRDMARDLYQIVGSTNGIFECKWQNAIKNRLSEKSILWSKKGLKIKDQRKTYRYKSL